MKCPECQHDQKVKYGMQCGRCGYRFTFNPKTFATKGLTDGRFLAAVQRASQQGTAVFTDNQLYAAYGIKARSNRMPLLVFGCLVGFVGLMITFANKVVGVAVLGVAAVLIALGVTARANVMRRAQFMDALDDWLMAGKEVPGLIREPSLHQPPESWPEPDIYDYGAERILIVERDLMVDLLVKNNQHVEQRMLVVSESGYPEYIVPHVNRLLEEHPQLPVFLMHDADEHGIQLQQRLQSLGWLKLGNHPVVDLGFFPEDFEQLKRTQNFENQRSDRMLPADALLIGSLATGLGACFASQCTFADELKREQQNQMAAGSSFG